MKTYTDYPFGFLGDKPFQKAPLRECEVLAYDGDKYVMIRVEGVATSIKICYVYPPKTLEPNEAKYRELMEEAVPAFSPKESNRGMRELRLKG